MLYDTFLSLCAVLGHLGRNFGRFFVEDRSSNLFWYSICMSSEIIRASSKGSVWACFGRIKISPSFCWLKTLNHQQRPKERELELQNLNQRDEINQLKKEAKQMMGFVKYYEGYSKIPYQFDPTTKSIRSTAGIWRNWKLTFRESAIYREWRSDRQWW